MNKVGMFLKEKREVLLDSKSEVRNRQGDVAEEPMYEGVFRRQPFVWVVFQHFLSEKK